MDTRTDRQSDSRALDRDQGVRTYRSATLDARASERQGETEPDGNIVLGED